MPLIPVGRQSACGRPGSFKIKPWKAVVNNSDHGWSPLYWVVYLGFFFIDPIASHATLKIWFLDLLGATVFLLLYFGLFFLERPRALVHIAGMVLLGLLFQPINNGACTFFIFAAAMLPFCVNTQTAAAVGLAVIAAIAGFQGFLLHLDPWTRFFSTLFPVFIGAGNMFFAERIIRLADITSRGIRTGLGTDGAASNNALSILRDVQIAGLAQRVQAGSVTEAPTDSLIRLATCDGGAVLGQPVGAIQPGHRADFIVLDLTDPSLLPTENLKSHVVHSLSPTAIAHVFCGGRQVVRDGRLTGIDQHEIAHRVNALRAKHAGLRRDQER